MVEIFFMVVIGIVIVGAFMVAVLFLMRIWDYLGGKKNNSGKED